MRYEGRNGAGAPGPVGDPSVIDSVVFCMFNFTEEQRNINIFSLDKQI
jgi:hypothetical protein